MMRKLFTISFMSLLLVLSLAGYGQELAIKGKVTSKGDGGALPGASILVKGTNRGSTTNSDGEFSINAPSNSTLVISFIGFKSLEVPVGTQTSLNISLG